MLFEHLFAHARSRPQEIAITDESGQYTYQQVAAMATGLGIYLAQQTQAPHVGLLLPAGVGFVAAFYGTLLAGKAVVPINFLLGDREVAHVIKNSEIDTVVTIPQLAGRLQNTPLKVVDLTQLPKTPPALAPPPFPSPKADDLAVLMYTSGTSALPKGVMLTYGNLQSDVDAAIELAQLEKRHVFLGVIPLFHAFGMTAMMLAPIQLAAPCIYMARFSAVGAMENVRKHKVSILLGVPSMFAALLHLKSASAEDFASIYVIISGGEPLPSNVREAFPARYGVPVLEGYGLTETSPVIALNVPQSSRAGSVGKLVPGATLKITDEQGHIVPEGESGEVWLKGPMIMKGYYKLPDESATALTGDGYFKTGDLGRMDADGFLYITGRKKDLIICAGEKVTPREVEEVLMQHPAIAEAAVVGRKDDSRGEAVVAFVVTKPGQTARPDEVRIFCREHGLAHFKIPRDFVFVEDLPRSPTGKVLKRQLAEKARALGT